jgi:hypothetical protein
MAKLARQKAEACTDDQVRDRLLRKAAQTERTAAIEEWINSPGAVPPEKKAGRNGWDTRELSIRAASQRHNQTSRNSSSDRRRWGCFAVEEPRFGPRIEEGLSLLSRRVKCMQKKSGKTARVFWSAANSTPP